MYAIQLLTRDARSLIAKLLTVRTEANKKSELPYTAPILSNFFRISTAFDEYLVNRTMSCTFIPLLVMRLVGLACWIVVTNEGVSAIGTACSFFTVSPSPIYQWQNSAHL